MFELVNIVFLFFSLYSFNVCEHVTSGEVLGEFFRLEGIEMETSKSNELPCVSEFSNVRAERLYLII